MKFIIQRVSRASVTVDGETVGRIDRGLLVFIGIAADDTTAVADHYLKKLINLRIFEDADGRTNLSLSDVGGSLLLVSQFTLYADCKKGNRPSFTQAAPPSIAEPLYEYILKKAAEQVPVVEHGIFGAHMDVSIENDGPFTIIFDF